MPKIFQSSTLDKTDLLIISYDISNNKLRTRFAKLITKYGYRLQYSVYKIENSQRVLQNIEAEIDATFAKKFSQSDSIYIFNLSKSCKIKRYGYAKNEESDLIVF